MSDKTIIINQRELNLTNLEKVLFPESGITKQDVIDYYQKIALHILPYLHNRALSLLRFPDGILAEKFFQKNKPAFFPAWIKSIAVPLKTIDKFDNYMVCNNLESLIYLANYVCVPHVWLSYYDKLNYPNHLIFDLDPSEKQDFTQVRLLSLKLHDFLHKLGLSSFAMLTGSRGMHVLVPIKRNKTFEQVRLFAKQVAQVLVNQNPDLYSIEFNINKRQDKILIDTLRNSYGATAVAPYAVRDKAGAPVATPISWQLVHDNKLSSQRYNIRNIFNYLAQEPNPWVNFNQMAVTLTEPMKKIKKYL